MIYFVHGRPGGGKSLLMAEKIYRELKRGRNVIANFEINMEYFSKCRHPEKLGKFIYVSNEELTTQAYKNIDPRTKQFSYIDGLWGFALNSHDFSEKGKKVQTVIVFDECAVLFNSRTFNARDRLEWLDLFINHQKLRYEIYMIAQDDSQIDKQMRGQFHKEIECRCVTTMKLFGKILALLCGGNLFVRIHRDYTLMKPMRKKDSREFAKYYTGRKYYNFYDSYKLFGGRASVWETQAGGLTALGAPSRRRGGGTPAYVSILDNSNILESHFKKAENGGNHGI